MVTGGAAGGGAGGSAVRITTSAGAGVWLQPGEENSGINPINIHAFNGLLLQPR